MERCGGGKGQSERPPGQENTLLQHNFAAARLNMTWVARVKSSSIQRWGQMGKTCRGLSGLPDQSAHRAPADKNVRDTADRNVCATRDWRLPHWGAFLKRSAHVRNSNASRIRAHAGI